MAGNLLALCLRLRAVLLTVKQSCHRSPCHHHNTHTCPLTIPAAPYADLRANAGRQAAGGPTQAGHTLGGGSGSAAGTLTNNELLRRLRETQALLIKFSEENGRLSQVRADV